MAKKKIDDEEEIIDDENTIENDNTVKKQVSQAFADTIKAYLDNYAKENPTFATKYSNEKKSIDECCNFIVNEVQKMKVRGLADSEVYYLARHYYEEDNIKVKSINVKVVVNHTVELTDEEKKQAHDKALKDFEKSEMERLKKQTEKARIKEQKKQEKLKQRQKESNQLSLFDF